LVRPRPAFRGAAYRAIADHAANIAEVVHLVEGAIVRHRRDQGIHRRARSNGLGRDDAKTKVLIIEDDRSLVGVLAYSLKNVLRRDRGHRQPGRLLRRS
jgi:hypothetical protein